MMDQKNKLAYENGRLQTQVEQTNLELESLRKSDLECTKYKQLAENLADKYTQVIKTVFVSSIRHHWGNSQDYFV